MPESALESLRERLSQEQGTKVTVGFIEGTKQIRATYFRGGWKNVAISYQPGEEELVREDLERQESAPPLASIKPRIDLTHMLEL